MIFIRTNIFFQDSTYLLPVFSSTQLTKIRSFGIQFTNPVVMKFIQNQWVDKMYELHEIGL
jgi:hypothetical protein